MLQWIGKVFGTDAAADRMLDIGERVVGMGGNIIDEAFDTKQERAERRIEFIQKGQQLVVDWIANTQGQNIARRVIAFGAAGTWLLMFIISSFMSVVSLWVDPVAMEVVRNGVTDTIIVNKFELAEERLDGRTEFMTPAVMLILVFYFGAPKVGEAANALIAAYSSKKEGKREQRESKKFGGGCQ